MERLGQRDLRALLDFVGDLYALRTLDEYAAHVVRALPRLVPSAITTYNEVNPRRQRCRWLGNPPDWSFPGSDTVFEAHIGEHPLIRYHARVPSGPTLKISDLLSRARFHRLGLYNEFFRRLDVEHQIVVVLPAPPPLLVGIALNRGLADFTERDRTLLDLTRPHLIAAYRNAEAVSEMRLELALLRRGVAAGGAALLALAPDGRVVFATPEARRRLEAYFGSGALRARRLPDALHRWLARHGPPAPGATDEPPGPPAPFVQDGPDRSLVVRLVPGPPLAFLLLEERTARPDARALETLGLTRREAEVLAWVAEGKTDWETGVILGISARTVAKHLEHVYRKLGVETRTAAVVRALQAPV